MISRIKKAELTTTQIVTLIILIMSFAVILFFIYQLGFKEQSQKQICRNSVELTSRDLLGVSSLNCKTQYLCLTEGDECSQIASASVIKDDFEKNIGDAMYDCFWQYGGGKYDFISWGKNPVNYAGDPKACGVCSQVYMNDVQVDNKKVLDYLNSNTDYTALKNSLVIPTGFNFDKSFVIVYSVTQNNNEQKIEVNYLDKIQDLQCEKFFNLA